MVAEIVAQHREDLVNFSNTARPFGHYHGYIHRSIVLLGSPVEGGAAQNIARRPAMFTKPKGRLKCCVGAHDSFAGSIRHGVNQLVAVTV